MSHRHEELLLHLEPKDLGHSRFNLIKAFCAKIPTGRQVSNLPYSMRRAARGYRLLSAA